MRLILVRHPKPQCEAGICYGRLDLECEPDALAAAVLRLRELAFTSRVFTSPARRARDLAIRLSAEAVVDDRLQELDFGAWEGRRWEDLGREAIDAWHQGLPDSAPPDGETLIAMAARCASWLKSLQPRERPVLAVTHGGPIRVIRAILEGKEILTYFAVPVPFAEPIELQLPTEAPDDQRNPGSGDWLGR
jgi:alpha-ribazole phosphatase